MNYIWIDILDLCYIVEEELEKNGYIYKDKRQWLPLFYGNRLGFLPYETEEEKQKILKDPMFFGYFDKDGNAIMGRESNRSLEIEDKEIKSNTKFELIL